MVNNPTIINKMDKHLFPQIIEHKKDHLEIQVVA